MDVSFCHFLFAKNAMSTSFRHGDTSLGGVRARSIIIPVQRFHVHDEPLHLHLHGRHVNGVCNRDVMTRINAVLGGMHDPSTALKAMISPCCATGLAVNV